MSTDNAILNLRALTDSERLEARQAAQTHVIQRQGPTPQRRDFRAHSIGKYPPWLQGLITALALVSLAAAFYLSALNLDAVGRVTVGKTHASGLALAGIAIVLLSEVSQVIFSLAIAIIPRSTISRALLLSGMATSTTIALCGNVQYAAPNNAFAWLVAIAPPALVLAIAYVLKEQALSSIGHRHENERAYQEALTTWHQATQNPEDSPHWRAAYANALKEALTVANSRGRGRSERLEILQRLEVDHWRWLVSRELRADSWFNQVDAGNPAPGLEGDLLAPFSENGHRLDAVALPSGNHHGSN